MNERIKQLAVQAGATLEKGYIELSDGQLMLSDNADLDISNMDLELFAELIVRECAELAGEETSLPYNSYSEKIKKHFGVEEWDDEERPCPVCGEDGGTSCGSENCKY